MLQLTALPLAPHSFSLAGVSNPPGNIRVQELPWPKLPVLVLWRAPFYTGNLSLYSYKAQVDSRTTAVTNRTSDVFYPVFPRLNIEISLYDEESMETLSDRNDPVVYDITNMCQFHSKLFYVMYCGLTSYLKFCRVKSTHCTFFLRHGYAKVILASEFNSKSKIPPSYSIFKWTNLLLERRVQK